MKKIESVAMNHGKRPGDFVFGVTAVDSIILLKAFALLDKEYFDQMVKHYHTTFLFR